MVDLGNGYYNIISKLGDGNTYYLNVEGSSTGNGTNIEIYEKTGGDSQKFILSKNPDGSFIIKTKVTSGNSAVEVAGAGKGSGNNIQQWNLNNYPNQNWKFIAVDSTTLKSNKNKAMKFSTGEEVVKTEVYKNDDCVHTVVFVK